MYVYVCVLALVYRTLYATELRCCALAAVALNGPRYNNLGASLLTTRPRLVGHRGVERQDARQTGYIQDRCVANTQIWLNKRECARV